MTNCEFLMTNQVRMTESPIAICAEGRADSRRRPRLARTEAATGVRHGKDANLVAERR